MTSSFDTSTRAEFCLIGVLFVLMSCGSVKEQTVPDARPATVRPEPPSVPSEPVVIQKTDVIAAYEDFLKRYGHVDPALRSEALKRLGDLYLEDGRRRFLKAMESYEQRPDGPPPLVNYGQAIQTYHELLRFDPTFRDQDQVLYALSRAYSETGRRELAQPLLSRLVENYPASPHSQEAYFRLGEYFFDQRQYAPAAEAYEQALSLDDHFFQDKARYKLGWTYFNVQAYNKAIEHFLHLVDQTVGTQQEISTDSGSLIWEALTYVAISFRSLGGPSHMATYFRETGSRAYEKDLYLMIGNQYIAAGQPQQAIGTYDTFVQQHPQHAMAPIFASYVMEVYERQKDAEAAQRARILLVNTYASTSAWYQANDDAARARSRPLVKESLHRLALSAHTKAQEDKRPEDYRQAVEWYKAFITEFPREKETPEVHFFLAESLLALQEYALAAAAYEASAYGYPEKGIDRKAAYAAVTTYEKVQTPAGQQQFLVLAQRFADHFPEDSQTPAILLKSGELLFDKQRYAEARGVLEGLLVHYPTFTASPIAQKLVAHSYMQQGQFDEARKAYGRTLALLPASEKTQRREASDLMAAAMYKQGEQHKKENRLDAAARAFQDIVKEAPESDLASAALFEAGALYETLKRSSEAISTYRTLVERDPNSPLAAKATLQMGFLYEQDKQWLQAAEAFETAARSIPDRELATQILWTAGLHYEKVSQWAKSYAVFATFTQQFPKHPDVPEGLLKMAQARQKQGKGNEALDLFARIEREAPGTPQAAQAVFQRAEEAFKGLKQIALKEPFKKQFKKKTQALEATVTLYTRAAESRFADVVATSAHRLGEVFEHFKTALLDAELPKKLTKEQAEEYRFQLEEKAFPFEEKAIQAYSSNVQRAQSQPGLYNEWVRKSYDRLAELRPSLYKRPERAERITSDIDPQNLSAGNPQSMTRKVLRAER